MARAKFAAIEEDIKTINSQISKDAEQSGKFDRLAKVLNGEQLTELKLDMDDQDFDAVRRNDAAVTENIAKLIHGLDAITQSFSTDFTEMTQSTVSEKLVGFFSRKKSETMKSDRVRSASIDQSLNELIRKSETIGGILNTQLNVLSERQTAVKEGQKNVNALYEQTEVERTELQTRLEALNVEYLDTKAKADETTGPDLAVLETAISELANQLNEARETLQTKTALQQSLSAYRKQYENYAESLAKQIAAQKTMIEKLKLDTDQRAILYQTLTESIKTSQQQEIAHQINETGQKTDDQADILMTQIGASSQNRVMTMLEASKEIERKLLARRSERERANAMFAQRFSKVIEDMDNRYLDDGKGESA
jgi:hypothetical protein